MRFSSPEWFILIPLLIITAWALGQYFKTTTLRWIILITLVTLLAGPECRRLQSGLDLWVLIDQSASAEERLLPRLQEWEGLLESAMSREDRIHYVDFADEVILRGDDESLTFTGNRNQTRMATVVEFVLARMRQDQASRLLIFTDGYSTEPLSHLAQRLLTQGVALDYRLVRDEGGADYRVDALHVPSRVQNGEPFLIELNVLGSPDTTVPFTLYHNDQPVGRSTIKIRGGRGTATLIERITGGGSYRYTVHIHPEEDRFPGNNVAETWVEVVSGPRVLLISAFTDDPLVPVLQSQGFEVDWITDYSQLHSGRLTGARAVIFNNVPAHVLPSGFMTAVDFFVRDQGGGLLMTGGAHSFGSGGYHATAVEELLPVSTEQRQDQRRLAVAMAIVLDRSGSMNAGVGGGLTKMNLANEGTAQAIQLLGNGDAITVFAVDTQPHEILPLTVLGNERDALLSVVRQIHSQGGGIYVYTGLKAAWEELKKANQGQRHIILFADAQDAEEPGDYKALIEEMTAAGVTITTVGLGTERDKDAAFLRDIAERGKGRLFFTQDAGEIPGIFAQDTVAVARSTFIDEPVGLLATDGWSEIAAGRPSWPASVDGYNLNYLRDGATLIAFTEDDDQAPLVASMQRGLGRTAALAFPVAGNYSQRFRTWEHYADNLQTLMRWLAGDALPSDYGFSTRFDGDHLIVELLYTESRENEINLNTPRLRYTLDRNPEIKEQLWERMEPGRYQSSMTLEPGRPLHGAIQIGNRAIPFGPVTLARNPEWDFDPTRVEALRQIARISGGEERLDLSRIWNAPRTPAFTSLQIPLLIILLLLILLDALFTRIGYSTLLNRTLLKTPQAKVTHSTLPPKPKKITYPKKKTTPSGEEPTPTTPHTTEDTRRLERFTKAKDRTR